LKLLFIDIETRPAKTYVWQLRKQDISVDQIIEPTGLLCFTAKWLGDDKLIYHASAKPEGPHFTKMVRAAHKLLSEADVVCHFNGLTFDIPRLNQEFLRLGLPPPPSPPQIDLKKVVMTKFSMVSSKLAFVGPYLSIGEKVKNEGWPLWIACMAGERDAWRKMEEYNKQDVLLLEELYKKLLPWIDNHPNMNLILDSEAPLCPNCGSPNLQRRGVHRATTNVYQRFSCSSCGRWSRARQADKAYRTTIR
jgi:hypothetical protein